MSAATGSRVRGRQRVVRQAASWCLAYPDAELVARVPLLRAALAEQRRHAISTRSSTTSSARRCGELAAARTSTSSTSPASTRSTCPTGPTATPAAAARCWRGSRRRTGPAASSSTPPASCPTTCRWCWSSPRRRPRGGRGAAAGVPPEPRAAADRAGRGRHAVRRRGRRRLRDAAGRLAGRPGRRAGDGRRPADRVRRARALRPAAAAAGREVR